MLANAAFWGAGCAIAWGFADFVARLAGRSVGAMAATFAMMLVGAVLMALVMVGAGEPISWQLDGLHWLLIIGAGATIGSMMFFYAVTHGPVSLASPVVASYPAISVPISVALGARPEPIHWAAMATTMAGVWIVARVVSVKDGEVVPKEYAPAVIRQTILLSLGAATIYAASLYAADRAVDVYGPWQTVLVMRVMGALVLWFVVITRKERARFPARAWPVLFAFGLLDTLGHLLLYLGLERENGEYAIVASVAYTVVTVLLARIFLREHVSLVQWGGIVLVVCGVALLSAFG